MLSFQDFISFTKIICKTRQKLAIVTQWAPLNTYSESIHNPQGLRWCIAISFEVNFKGSSDSPCTYLLTRERDCFSILYYAVNHHINSIAIQNQTPCNQANHRDGDSIPRLGWELASWPIWIDTVQRTEWDLFTAK